MTALGVISFVLALAAAGWGAPYFVG
jgi:hypothetical protein